MKFISLHIERNLEMDREKIPYELFLNHYNDCKDIMKALKYAVSKSRKESLYLGVQYITDGEKFQSVTKFTIAEFGNNTIQEKQQKILDDFKKDIADKFNSIGEDVLREKFPILYGMKGIDGIIDFFMSHHTDAGESVEYALNNYTESLITGIAKTLISTIIITNDIIDSIESYKKATEKSELDVSDIEYLYDYKTKAHSQDKYFYKPRKGETWTLGDGILNAMDYDVNEALLKMSVGMMKGL